MNENKRYVDDGFEVIDEQSFTDTETNETYYVEYFDEIIDLLNEKEETIQNQKKYILLLKRKLEEHGIRLEPKDYD